MKKPTAYMNACKAVWPYKVHRTGKRVTGSTGRLVWEYQIVEKHGEQREVIDTVAGIDGIWGFAKTFKRREP